MKLHLPKMLAAAVLAAITTISAYAAVPAYSGTIYTWNGTTTGQDPARGVFCTTTYDGDTPNVQEDNISGWTDPVQGMIASLGTVPSNTLRFDSTHGQSVKALNYTFNPFTLAGIIVEDGASGFAINSGGSYDRNFYLGNGNEVEAFSAIREDFSVNKTSGGGKMYLRGTQTIDIASGKTFTLQSNNGIDLSGSLTTTGSGTLNIATGDVVLATATTLTFNSNVTIGHALSVSVSGITEGADPIFTLNGTGNLSLGSFSLGGMGSLENGTYAIASTTEALAGTLTGAFSGTDEYKLSYEGGILSLIVESSGGPIPVTSNTDLLFSDTGTRGYHISGGATLSIDNGSGGRGGAAAGSTYDYGPITVEGEGSRLRVWNWGGTVQTLNTTDKVTISSRITVKDGGTIFMEDGSYYFAGGVNVNGSGSIQMQWAKGALLDCLTSEEGTTDNSFTITTIGSDPDDRIQLYGILHDGEFDGTVNLDPRDAGPLRFAIGSENALQNAVLNLGDGSHPSIVALNTAATNMKGIQGKGSITLATGLTGNAGITESVLTLTGTGSSFSGSIGEGVTIAVAKGADLALSGQLGLYTGLNVTGALTLNSDLVIDLTHLAYEEDGTKQVFHFANLAEGAAYTGYDALTEASVTGVLADSVEFKDDGTIVITKTAPHAIAWDPNWGVTGPDVLSAELTADTALISSPYKDGNDVTVELTGAGNADAFIYGVQDSGVNNTGTTYVTNVWIDAKEGSYKAIVGGSYCNNWNDGGALNLEGDTHIQLDGATVGTVIGGNLKDGKNPQFNGSSYISVISGDVTAAIIGSSTNSHNAATTQTGDTHIFVYVPLAQSDVNPLPGGAPKNQVIGASAHVDNTVGTATLNGSTHVTIDLSKYEGGTTSFVKSIIGGHFSDAAGHTQNITGDTNVTIMGGDIEFSGDIIGGNRNNNGASKIGGSSTLGITGGTYSGAITGGTKVSAGASSEIGNVVVSLGGAAQIGGDVYAAGLIDGDGTGASTVASTTVNVGAGVTVTGTLSGGFGGTGAARGSVSGMRVLNLNEAEEYTNLSAATLAAFDEISVAGGASATVSGISDTTSLDKTGSGALTLSGATTLDTLTVSAGRLTFDATGTEIGAVNVVSGATLSSTDTASTKAAITLDAGSTLSVGTAGLALASGSEFTLSGGKVNFSYTGVMGQEIIVASGLTVDTIHGISFNQTGALGDYAIAADYLTMGAQLADYTQLRVKDGNLILGKAAGGGSYWGAGIGGGTWDMASINWADDDNLTATRTFTDSNAAHFTAAGLGGAINVSTAINVTTINVSGATYTFTGGQNLNITNGISVTDSGVATFDKVAGELKNVYIAGTASKLTITGGDVTVNAFSSEGTFTTGGNLAIKSAVANGGSVVAGGNVTLASGTENVFGSLNATGKVTGASKLTVGGASAIGSVEGIGSLVLANGTLSLGNASGLANTQLGGALTLTGEAVNLGSVTMTNGSSISSSKVVLANGITVSGTGTVKGGATLQTASVGGTGTLAVEAATVGIASGSTMTVSGTLDVKSGAHISNSGTLAVTNTGRVIAGNGVSLGTVDAKGTIELNGASVSATGGSITALDMGSGETLTVANDLALTSTTGSAGTLSVGGALTVGGAATIGNVSAGTLELTTSGTLTATGTLDAGTITLDRVSKTDHYLTAGGLSESTTAFVVDKALIEALNVSAGQIITLADLDTVHTGAANLTINGAKYITDTHDLGYYISQDSVTKDIILIARNQESNYVWVGSVNENWSEAANWSGGLVPDETSWVQFNGGEQSILLDQLVKTRRLTVSAGTHDTIYGDQNLLLTQSLEVDGNATLNVGDGSTETMVSAPEVQVSGELNVQENAFVDAGHTTIKGGVLNVADGGSYFTGVVDMTEGGSLYTEGEASITAEQLNGDLDSTLGGKVTVYGNGGRYTGGYDGAYIDIVEDADATLYANDGLTLGGDGTAKLQYSGSTAIDGIDADALTIILNDPNASSIGSTLELNNTSLLEDGSVVFGMSAIESAKTLGAGAPQIIEGNLVLGDGTTVVVNQDASADGGQAMEVRNYGKTRSLELARIGGAETDTQNVQLNGYLYGKYYMNARIEGGKLLVDMRDDFYRTVSGAHTPNGIAGAQMVDAAFVENNPQITDPAGDLAAVMTALENGAVAGEAADKALAAMGGASVAAMGAALGSDVDRQLRAVRNRTTSMGLNDCLVNEDLPYFNAWVNAEGDYRRLKADGTLAGYKLSSWGGTVGFDVDCTPRFTCGLALTAMKGNFTANAAESADGDLDRMYVSAFARYSRRSLTQTLVGTFGRADAKLDRTVDYGAGAYRTEGDTDGTAFGVMYEIGYAKALNEDATTCLQPVLNLSYRHSTLGGFTEKGGSDAALVADDAEMNVFTAAVGARLQSVVGTSVYNRSSLFEGRVLVKLDSGDRDVAVRNHFVGVRNGADAKSAEVGAFGVEVGAGITLPIAEDGGSLFFDVTGEFRSGYSEVNGTAGYRFNF